MSSELDKMNEFDKQLAERLSDPTIAYRYLQDAASNSEPDELYQAIEQVNQSMTDPAERQHLALKAYHDLLFTLPRAAQFAGMDAQAFEQMAANRHPQ